MKTDTLEDSIYNKKLKHCMKCKDREKHQECKDGGAEWCEECKNCQIILKKFSKFSKFQSCLKYVTVKNVYFIFEGSECGRDHQNYK